VRSPTCSRSGPMSWRGEVPRGGASHFDVANVHYVRHGDRRSLNVTAFGELFRRGGFNGPVWVTEAEFGRADDLLVGVEGAFAQGASRIFFTQSDFSGEHRLREGGLDPIFEEAIRLHAFEGDYREPRPTRPLP
jgi:hypothetical protein